MFDFKELQELIKKYEKLPVKLQYGTAGFRAKATNLECATFRVGVIAALRSKKVGKKIGLMITASHNPSEDNGIKLIDPDGEMLEEVWEQLATTLVNCDADNIVDVITNIIQVQDIDIFNPAVIMIGRDTRSSSPMLSSIAIEGVKSMQAVSHDCGVVTTPMLHFFVQYMNSNPDNTAYKSIYFSKLTGSFLKFCSKEMEVETYVPELNLDGANGVGAIEAKHLATLVSEYLKINIYNDDVDDYQKLNNKCGADYVKVKHEFPVGMPIEVNTRYASVDGDSDRLVYYYTDENSQFHLLDGDKIAALIATYLSSLVVNINWFVHIGVVQTAYANGNSTRYIENVLEFPVSIVETGVKHLHAKAKEYAVGIYFEANGHGTVVFSEQIKRRISLVMQFPDTFETNMEVMTELSTFIDLVNETIGDAMSDMLIVEAILRKRRMTIQDWDRLYFDLPNKLLQVRVKDKNVIVTYDADRRCEKPENLQDAIDNEVRKFAFGRSFVRPSGTEDVVRVYAEAQNQSDANTLALNVAKLVYKMADGVGDIPEL